MPSGESRHFSRIAQGPSYRNRSNTLRLLDILGRVFWLRLRSDRFWAGVGKG